VNLQRVRLVTCLIVLTLVAAACGARVSEQQIKSAGASGGASGSGGLAAGSGDAGSGATDAGTTPGSSAAGGAATAGTTPAAGASTGAAAPASGAAPAGGNGGAVDVGVSATQVTLGNVSTLSGPVPGLFQGAVVGAQAIVAYQNSVGGLFGRKFKLDFKDDQFDTGQNRTATTELTQKAFAMLGSFSLYDDAGKDAVAKSGMPDVTYSLTGRRDLPNNFSVEPARTGGAPLGPFNYFGKKFPAEIKAVGSLHPDIPSANQSQTAYVNAAKSVGWNVVYDRAIAATETDFTADIVRMKSKGVKLFYAGALDDKTLARIVKALAQQGMKIPVVTSGIGYDADIPKLAGTAAEGLYTWQPYSMYAGEDAGIAEVKLMNQWIQRVKPGWVPDTYTVFAWASGRLLFEAMQKAGAKAKRADVVAALKTITKFDAGGLLAPANPAAKGAPTCGIVTQVKGGKYVRIDSPPPGYRCSDGGYHQ
jgi:ABC-type branched-subunit amino acid transport system substrate-binding protein